MFAGLALALVIIYRSTRAINFAQGEMATFTTFIAWTLVDHGIGYWAAVGLTLLIAFVGGIALERVLVRPVENRPVINGVILTIGLFIALTLEGSIESLHHRHLVRDAHRDLRQEIQYNQALYGRNLRDLQLNRAQLSRDIEQLRQLRDGNVRHAVPLVAASDDQLAAIAPSGSWAVPKADGSGYDLVDQSPVTDGAMRFAKA